jgi:uncharacterized protein DUF3500
MTSPWLAPATAGQMRAAAAAFLDSLSAEQTARAAASFDSPDHHEWTYLPGPRPGLALADMSDDQRELALRLLDTGLSEQGGTSARAIMALESTLRHIEEQQGLNADHRDPGFFWFRVLGDPRGNAPWAWRANGHHLAVHLTIIGDAIAATPQFFGANPARVPATGHRTLPAEEDRARELLASLDAEQRQVAISGPIAPDDILTRRDPVADPARIAAGIEYSRLTLAQRDLLGGLVHQYVDRVAPEIAELSWRRITDVGIEAVRFTWSGSDVVGEGHYYAVTGPTFLLEYDNVQNNNNHIHSVWRDIDHDWGHDILQSHYAHDAHPTHSH